LHLSDLLVKLRLSLPRKTAVHLAVQKVSAKSAPRTASHVQCARTARIAKMANARKVATAAAKADAAPPQRKKAKHPPVA
jgi:hypothetical protein